MWPSIVPMNSRSSWIATPRFKRPQHGRACGDGLYEYVQNGRPVTASSAMMSFGGWTIYMMPSTTTGVTSKRVLVGSRDVS